MDFRNEIHYFDEIELWQTTLSEVIILTCVYKFPEKNIIFLWCSSLFVPSIEALKLDQFNSLEKK